MDSIQFNPSEQQQPVDLIAYCDGPSLYRPTGLASGEYYSGRAAVWVDSLGALKTMMLPNPQQVVTRSSTGNTLNYLGAVLIEPLTRLNKLTACYDNSGNIAVAIEETTTGVPNIWVGYNSGLSVTGWQGYNPVIYNNLNQNFPWGGSTDWPKFSVFRTGTLGCYYTNSSGTDLYVRQLSENFAVETLVNSGLLANYTPRLAEVFPNVTVRPYDPYRKRIFAYDAEGNLVIYSSKPTIRFAFDNFELYPTGRIVALSSGYGLWIRDTTLHPTKGSFEFVDQYFYDSMEAYATGNISFLNNGVYYTVSGIDSRIREYIGLYVGQFTGQFDIFCADSFELYPSGNVNFYLNSGQSSGIIWLPGYVLPSGS